MFADYTVLIGDSEEKIKRLVHEFERIHGRRKLKVNVNKIQIMKTR